MARSHAVRRRARDCVRTSRSRWAAAALVQRQAPQHVALYTAMKTMMTRMRTASLGAHQWPSRSARAAIQSTIWRTSRTKLKRYNYSIVLSGCLHVKSLIFLDSNITCTYWFICIYFPECESDASGSAQSGHVDENGGSCWAGAQRCGRRVGAACAREGRSGSTEGAPAARVRWPRRGPRAFAAARHGPARTCARTRTRASRAAPPAASTGRRAPAPSRTTRSRYLYSSFFSHRLFKVQCTHCTVQSLSNILCLH